MTAVVVCIVYLVSVTLLGSLLARRAASSSGWAVASGNMGLWMVAAGVAGTRIGGVGTYGVAGDVMATGLWNLWYGVNTFLALALVGLFFAVPFRRLGLSTVAEIFTRRYGTRRCQVLTSLCVQTEYFIVNVLEPFVIGSILSTLTGIPFGVAVFIAAGVLIAYTALGGLWGSAVTNLVHCVVVVLGLGAIVVAGVNHLGGWAEVTRGVDAALLEAGPQAVSTVSWWSFVGAGWGAVLAMFFSATIHTPAASVYVNFSSAARSEKTLAPAFLLGGAVAALMPLLAGLVGVLALARYGYDSGLASYRSITQVAIDISPILGGVAVAAILAAVISSGGPILLASATMVVRDWVPGSDKVLFGDAAARLSRRHRGLRPGRGFRGLAGGDPLDSRSAPPRLRDGRTAGDRDELPAVLAPHERGRLLLGHRARLRHQPGLVGRHSVGGGDRVRPQ